jgi:GNAT superfamily N-acetyltransferase
MSLVVRPVAESKDIDAFLAVPFPIYAKDKNWVAPLFLERKEHLDPRKNPYFLHADVQLFLAERDGKPIGRISAQIDRLRLERYRDATGQFGFLEAPDDPAVFAALLGAAEQWLASRGIKRAQGPFSFSINDETGLLIDGFDRPPAMMMNHALPYHARHLEAAGFTKAKDVIAYDYDAREPMPRAMAAMIERAKASGLRIRPFSKRNLDRDLAIIIDIFNDAWSKNWGFTPMTREEVAALGKNLKMLVKDEYIPIAEINGEPVAMAVSLPDINRWIAGLDGRLIPFGWLKLIGHLFRPPEAVRIPLMGVRKKHHGTPLGAALALGVIDAIRTYHTSRGTYRAELSWILEDNWPMRRIIEQLGAVPYKNYRVYEKSLA